MKIKMKIDPPYREGSNIPSLVNFYSVLSYKYYNYEKPLNICNLYSIEEKGLI